MYQRDLSCFLCQELMYEYLIKSLDSKRSDAVSRHLESCEKCKLQYQYFLQSQNYLDQLAETKVTDEFLTKLKRPTPSLSSKKMKGWKNLPDPIRWSIESLVVGGIFALLFTLITNTILTHKEKIESADITLAKIDKPIPEEPSTEDSQKDQKQASTKPDESQKTDKPDATVTVAQNNSANQQAASTQKTPNQESTQANTESKASSVNRKGYVFRANMATNELTKVTSEIVARIESVGGKKAGEVKLGWERKNGNYFHFTIPESDQEAFFNFLRAYGPIHISKDPHPRVMPEGVIRMILWVRNNQVPPSPPPPSVDPQSPTPDDTTVEEENEGS